MSRQWNNFHIGDIHNSNSLVLSYKPSLTAEILLRYVINSWGSKHEDPGMK